MEQNKVESDSFWKRLILIVTFFTITPITLFASVLSLVSISNPQELGKNTISSNGLKDNASGIQVFSSGESSFPSISGDVIADDARPEIIRQYLENHDSPMEPYSKFIVETSDRYNLDFRLLTAIAQKESGLGRAMPSDDCNNAWGYGIHSQGTLCFDSWEEGIEIVSKGLKENYVDKGYVTVEQIMKKYAHPDSTTWAEGVLQYMSNME